MNELNLLYAICTLDRAKIAAVHNTLSVIGDTEVE